MLEIDREKRIKMKDIARHPWIKGHQANWEIKKYKETSSIDKINEKIIKEMEKLYGISSQFTKESLQNKSFNTATATFQLLTLKFQKSALAEKFNFLADQKKEQYLHSVVSLPNSMSNSGMLDFGSESCESRESIGSATNSVHSNSSTENLHETLEKLTSNETLTPPRGGHVISLESSRKRYLSPSKKHKRTKSIDANHQPIKALPIKPVINTRKRSNSDLRRTNVRDKYEILHENKKRENSPTIKSTELPSDLSPPTICISAPAASTPAKTTTVQIPSIMDEIRIVSDNDGFTLETESKKREKQETVPRKNRLIKRRASIATEKYNIPIRRCNSELNLSKIDSLVDPLSAISSKISPASSSAKPVTNPIWGRLMKNPQFKNHGHITRTNSLKLQKQLEKQPPVTSPASSALQETPTEPTVRVGRAKSLASLLHIAKNRLLSKSGESALLPRKLRNAAFSNATTSFKPPDQIIDELMELFNNKKYTYELTTPFYIKACDPKTRVYFDVEVCSLPNLSDTYFIRMQRIAGDWEYFKQIGELCTSVTSNQS